MDLKKRMISLLLSLVLCGAVFVQMCIRDRGGPVYPIVKGHAHHAHQRPDGAGVQEPLQEGNPLLYVPPDPV